MSEHKFCPDCGEALLPQKGFCPQCGSPATAAPAEIRVSPPKDRSPAQVTPEAAGSSKCPNCGSFKWVRRSGAISAGRIIALLGVVLAVIVVGFYALTVQRLNGPLVREWSSEALQEASRVSSQFLFVGLAVCVGIFLFGGLVMLASRSGARRVCALCGHVQYDQRRSPVPQIPEEAPVAQMKGLFMICPHCGKKNPWTADHREGDRCQWCHECYKYPEA